MGWKGGMESFLHPLPCLHLSERLGKMEQGREGVSGGGGGGCGRWVVRVGVGLWGARVEGAEENRVLPTPVTLPALVEGIVRIVVYKALVFAQH